MVKRKIGAFLMSLGLLFGMAALSLTAYNEWDDYRAGNEVEKVVEAVVRLREEIRPVTASTSESDTESNSQLENESDRELPVVEIDGNPYIGTISLPTLALELPVMKNWSLTLLKTAPCRYMGSPYSDDLIICAHNYTTHFGKLNNLALGDEVIFTDMEGKEFHYTVTELDTIAGTAIEEMESGEWDLTLFTCTLSGQTRFTVRCNLTESGDQ